jgi:mRNA-degrading endonuclease RelE of RelBE toxin-antitoxin system
MILHRLEMSQAVRNLITHLPPELKRKVRNAFRAIAEDPYQAKELKDELVGLRSYRLGNARIIFRLTGQVVEIVAFGPRHDIYERVTAELSTLLRRKDKGKTRT